MITGFNTDIRHRDVVFHVQTEDKGLSNPCVESLVYVGGQIIGRKRSGYQAILKDGGGKEAILELLERQHRDMIGEIRAGELDSEVERRLGPFESSAPAGGTAPTPKTPPAKAPPKKPPPARAAAPAQPPGANSESATPSLDQVILDYLSSEAEQEHLVLNMDASQDLELGDRVVLAFHTETSPSARPVAQADVAIRLISTSSEPAVLGRGSTDAHGDLSLQVEIPAGPKGSSALIVTATSEIGTAEIKHLL